MAPCAPHKAIITHAPAAPTIAARGALVLAGTAAFPVVPVVTPAAEAMELTALVPDARAAGLSRLAPKATQIWGARVVTLVFSSSLHPEKKTQGPTA